MRLTNEQFVEQIMSFDVKSNDLVTYFVIGSKLLKTYGKVIYTESYSKIINNISPDLWRVILMLKLSKKDHPEDIKNLIRLIKSRSKNYTPEFTIKTDSEEHYTQIVSYLNENFEGNTTTKHTSMWNSIRVSGEWWYYKRWLSQDIQKILKLN